MNQLVLDAVLDSMHANLYVTDPQTDKILFMNRAMKEEYGLESPEGSVCWQVLQNGLAERCSFCPIDVLSQSGQQAMVMQWEEDSPVTGRLYRNYDSLVTWLDGSIVHLQQSVDITELQDGAHRRADGPVHPPLRQGPPARGHGPRNGQGRIDQRLPVRHQPT